MIASIHHQQFEYMYIDSNHKYLNKFTMHKIHQSSFAKEMHIAQLQAENFKDVFIELYMCVWHGNSGCDKYFRILILQSRKEKHHVFTTHVWWWMN